MGYYVAKLKRPYDYRSLIEAYTYTRRTDFVHADFTDYYAGLLDALQAQFGIRLAGDGLPTQGRVFLMLFDSTARSLLRITSPWSSYLDATLLHVKLEQSGELGRLVDRASAAIHRANDASEVAHREMLEALFLAVFPDCRGRVVTSDELRAAGFDDSREPDIADYYDSF